MSGQTDSNTISRADPSHHRRVEEVLKTSLKLLTLMGGHTVEEIMQFALDEGERLTGSSIGYFHFVNPDQETIVLKAWSKNTHRVCAVGEKNSHYTISQAGVWVDCIRERRPVIHNNYESLPHKKGLPSGHVPVIREMSIPVIDNGSIVAVFGVGNKEEDYQQNDVDQLSLLAENTWSIIRRKRVEEALQKSEQRLELALQGADLGLWDYNLSTGEVFYNDRWARIRGYSPGEVEPTIRSFLIMIHPDDVQMVKKAFDRHANGETPFYESVHRSQTKSGDWRWVLDRGKVVERDGRGKAIRAAGTNIDITVSKEIETKLVESERRYRALYESSRDGILFTDMAGNIMDANQAYLNMVGYSLEQLQSMTFQQLTPKKWRSMEQDVIAKQILTRGYSDEYEKEYVKKDGTILPVTLRVWLTDDEDGKPNGMWGIVRDITDRKKTEQERERLITELQDALAKVKTLSGFLPICTSCKKIRDDQGYWNQIENYIHDHSEAEFTHSICPECRKKLYPPFDKS